MRDFWEALWPGFQTEGSAGSVTFWFAPSKKSLHVPLQELSTASDEDFRQLQWGARLFENVYYGLGLREHGLPSSRQGGKQTIVALPGFALDIDFANPKAHKASDLPTSDAEAYAIIEKLPDPSIIVFTGNGWHVYWLFLTAILLESASERNWLQKAYKLFQAPIIKRAKEQFGWQVDHTASIQRVWRVPGCLNRKTDRPVEVLHLDPSIRYDIKELVPNAPGSRSISLSSASLSAPQPATQIALDRLRKSLEKLDKDNHNKAAIDLLLAGESFADKGDRDNMLQRVCSTVAWMPEAKGIEASDLAELFRSSLEKWAEEPDAEKSVEEEIEKVVDKILRAQQDKHDVDERRKEDYDELRSVLKAHDKEIKSNADLDFIESHAVIQKRTSFFVFNFDVNEYVGPFVKDEVVTYLRQAWQNAPPSFDLTYVNAKGERKQKTMTAIMRDYGHIAEHLIGEMNAKKSYYDVAENTFYEAIARVRPNLEPEFDENIDTWLRLLAGEQAEKVLDWIAAVPQIDRQCCVLYLDGVSGAGKGLLAAGLARLWHAGGATPLINVLGNFNADMFRCPLLFLDEGLPKRAGSASQEIRALVGASTFTFSEKFVSNRVVLGSIRLLVAANNDSVFFGNENLSVNDLEAVVGRFLHVKANRPAALWLEKHNKDNKLTESWVQEDKLAKHCLWLCANRKIKPGKRFLVEGVSMDAMHQKLVTQGEINGLVCEWLTRFMDEPQKLYQVYSTKDRMPLAQIGNGKLHVNTQGVVDAWEVYLGDKAKQLSVTQIGGVLKRLSAGVDRLGTRTDRIRFHDIKTDLVLGWARDNQIGDDANMMRNLLNEKTFENAEDDSDDEANQD